MAMPIKDILQGKWLGHPLHPALVHVPTGLWPAALVFDLVSLASDDPIRAGAMRVALWCLVVGILAALAAAPTGLADFWDIKSEKPAHKLGLWHLSLNIVVLLLMIASVIVRGRGGAMSIAIILNAIGNAILFVSGYLGGRMVYEYGVGVARISKKKWRQIAIDGHAHVPPAPPEKG